MIRFLTIILLFSAHAYADDSDPNNWPKPANLPSTPPVPATNPTVPTISAIPTNDLSVPTTTAPIVNNNSEDGTITVIRPIGSPSSGGMGMGMGMPRMMRSMFGDDTRMEIPQAPPPPGEGMHKPNRELQPICDPAYSNAALMVIDMQPYFSKRSVNPESPENQEKVRKILKAQADAIQAAKKAGIPIVVVEYRLMIVDENKRVDYQTSPVLTQAIGDYPTTKLVTKTSDGIFSNGNDDIEQIKEYMKAKKIGTLIVTGANGGACVRDSIRTALKHNCNVIAYSKGIADFNFEAFIYPYNYDDKFKNQQTNCPNCSFREIDDLDRLQFSMKYSGDPTSTSTQGGSNAGH